MSSEHISPFAKNEYQEALTALSANGLESALHHGQAALADAQETDPRPRLFICRCQCLLANALGRTGAYQKSGEFAQEAIFVCSLLPMTEEVFDVWAKSIIYRSAALCGLGDHISAMEALRAGKHQVKDFPGMTALGQRVFDDQINLLEQRFGAL